MSILGDVVLKNVGNVCSPKRIVLRGCPEPDRQEAPRRPQRGGSRKGAEGISLREGVSLRQGVSLEEGVSPEEQVSFREGVSLVGRISTGAHKSEKPRLSRG